MLSVSVRVGLWPNYLFTFSFEPNNPSIRNSLIRYSYDCHYFELTFPSTLWILESLNPIPYCVINTKIKSLTGGTQNVPKSP